MTAVGRQTATRLSATWKPFEREARNTCCCQLQHSGGAMTIKNFAIIWKRGIQ